MSKPTSIRTQPWASFDKKSYSIISDDFVHEKLLTVKVNLKTKGTLNIKKIVTKKGDEYKTQGEIKLWFPVWNTRNGHLYFRSKKNQIKIHYDDGVKGLTLGKFENYNLYGSYQSDKNLKNIVLKAGANLIAQNFNVDNIVRVGLAQQGQANIQSGIKAGYRKNNWTVDSYDIINWKTKALINNALRIAYHKDNNEVYLRAQNQTTRNFSGFNWTSLDSYFTKFTLDFVRKFDEQAKIALEGQFTKSSFGKTSVVVQRNVSNRDLCLKLKLTSNKSVAFSAQSILNDYGKWIAGFEVSDLGKTNKAKFGLQFDVNL